MDLHLALHGFCEIATVFTCMQNLRRKCKEYKERYSLLEDAMLIHYTSFSMNVSGLPYSSSLKATQPAAYILCWIVFCICMQAHPNALQNKGQELNEADLLKFKQGLILNRQTN